LYGPWLLPEIKSDAGDALSNDPASGEVTLYLWLCVSFWLKTKHRTRLIAAVMTVFLLSENCFAFSDGDVQFWQTTCAHFDINKDWAVVP
jgi:hypothetical protein